MKSRGQKTTQGYPKVLNADALQTWNHGDFFQTDI